MFFLLVGFALVSSSAGSTRISGEALPLLGSLLGEANAPGGVVSPEFYNQLGAMHGTIMVFLGIVPLAFGAFGNYIVPLQIGAPDMAFPRLNAASYWLYAPAASSCSPASSCRAAPPTTAGRRTRRCRTSHRHGQTLWLVGMLLLIFSSLLGAMNFIATIIQLRAPGMTWFRLPFFVWAQFITAFLLLLAFPALQAAAVLQGMDRIAGTSFFLPSGLVVTGQPADVAGGGNALLWQHLFWFLGHPEVYVLILPAMGIIAEVIANNTRKPLWGYRLMVYSIFVLGFLSFVVWAHHMFLTGMGTTISAFFQATTMIISIPSVIILSSLILSLYGGSIRFNTPMLFALAFMPMFGLGGLTGLPLGLAATDIPLHDTNYVVAPLPLSGRARDDLRVVRRHLLLVPEDHRPDDERDARPDSLRRLAHLHERDLHADVHPGSGRREPAAVGRRRDLLSRAGDDLSLNVPMVYAAFGLAFFQLFFIVNLLVSIRAGRIADTNPWEATTLEWAATSTPPRAHGNFERPVRVYRDPVRLQRAGRRCRASCRRTR